MSDTNLAPTGAAPAAAPPADTVPDFDSMSRQEIQDHIASLVADDDLPVAPADEVAEVADSATPPEEAPAEDEAADEADAPDEPVEEPAAEEGEEAPEPIDLKAFKFTEGADPEVRAAEEARLLEQFELEGPIAEMISYRDSQIAELQQKIETLPAAADAEYVAAFEEMATSYRELEPGVMVPNTEKFREFLVAKYPKEADQLFIDWNSSPSDKYQGLKKYHEVMIDGFGLDQHGLSNVETVLQNGGRFPLPSFVPDGIDASVLEAFWTHPQSAQIKANAEAIIDDINNPDLTDMDRDAARRELGALNQQLKLIQNGLNADRQQTESQMRAKTAERQQILEEGSTSATNVLVNLLEVESQAISSHLAAAMEGPAADLGAGAVMALIQNAFEDNNQYATWAQKKLESVGIKTDWKRAKADIESLYELETKMVAQKKAGANQVAIEKTERERNALIKQLKSYAKELRGHATQKMLTGSTKALQKKVAAAPKISGARPRANASAGAALPSKVDLTKMSPEELRSHIGHLRREAGILG